MGTYACLYGVNSVYYLGVGSRLNAGFSCSQICKTLKIDKNHENRVFLMFLTKKTRFLRPKTPTTLFREGIPVFAVL